MAWSCAMMCTLPCKLKLTRKQIGYEWELENEMSGNGKKTSIGNYGNWIGCLVMTKHWIGSHIDHTVHQNLDLCAAKKIQMILKLIKSKWVRTIQYIFQQSQTVLYALYNKENEVCPLLFMIIVICQIIHLEFNNQPCMNQYSSRVRHWLNQRLANARPVHIISQSNIFKESRKGAGRPGIADVR